MNREVEKYIWYYMLVYIIVLAICGFFQYMAVCQGKSLACAFDMEGINTIITTTAYVLTPIVAILGFNLWRYQERCKQERIYAEKVWKFFDDVYISSENILKHIYFDSPEERLSNSKLYALFLDYFSLFSSEKQKDIVMCIELLSNPKIRESYIKIKNIYTSLDPVMEELIAYDEKIKNIRNNNAKINFLKIYLENLKYITIGVKSDLKDIIKLKKPSFY